MPRAILMPQVAVTGQDKAVETIPARTWSRNASGYPHSGKPGHSISFASMILVRVLLGHSSLKLQSRDWPPYWYYGHDVPANFPAYNE